MSEPHAVRTSDTRFILGFTALAVVSGITIGITKVLNLLLAHQLGATPFQISLLAGVETLGIVLVTIPAGFIIDRFGARPVYLLFSLLAALAYLASPWAMAWWQLLPIATVVGICVPFRVVSMSGAFLERLGTLGEGKTGWYRASLMTGMLLLGPLIGTLLHQHLGFLASYAVVSALFLLMGNSSLGVLPGRSGASAPGGAQSLRPLAILRSLGGLLAVPGIGRTCVVEFAGALASSCFTTFAILIGLTVFRVDAAQAVTPLIAQGAAFVGLLFLGGRTLAWLSQANYQRLGQALMVAALATIGLAERFWALHAGAALLGLGFAMQHLVNVRRIGAAAVDKGRVSGLFGFAGTAGGLAGVLLGGLLSRFIPVQSVFLALIPVFLLLIAVLAAPRRPLARGARPAGWRRRLGSAAFTLGYLAFGVAAWDLLVRFGWLPSLVVVPPARVWETLVDLARTGELWDNFRASLGRVGAGYAVGSLLGLGFGFAFGLWQWVRQYFAFSFNLIRQVPSVGWIPLLILICGIEEGFKVVIIGLTAFFPVALATIDGVSGVPRRYREVAEILRLSPVAQVFKVILPAALPDIITGLRLGLSRSWMIVVAAELFGSDTGLGHLMDWGRQLFQLDLLMAAVLVTAVTGFAIDRILIYFEWRFLAWRKPAAA